MVQLCGRDSILTVAFGAAVLGDVKINALTFGLNLQVNDRSHMLLTAGEPLTRPIERTFCVPLGGLSAQLQAVIDEQYWKITIFHVAPFSSHVWVAIKVDNEWLSWQWIDLETDKVLLDEPILALP